MIDSLHISGFKLFRDITLPRLGRLNLFVGENNSGKSCLLEAINVYAERDPIRGLLHVAALPSPDKMMPWGAGDFSREGTSLRHSVFELFRHAGPFTDRRFLIERVGDKQPVHAEFALFRPITNVQGPSSYVLAAPGDEGAEVAIPVWRGDKRGLITRNSLPLPSPIPDTAGASERDVLSVAFLPAAGFSGERAASMWDALVQGPGEDLVLSWLRTLDARIEDLAYIGGPDARVAVLKIEGQSRLPLRSMGDGLTKLFHIALAVASASEGILLIDEFENGLHWTAQEKLWKALARAARDFNVQVFATTHSRDCIESFAAAAKDAGPDGASIYRLERRGDDVIATDLPLINVDAAMRQHVEVR